MKKLALLLQTFLFTTYLCVAQTTHDVSIVNFAFSPSTLTINVGDIVKWTNNGSISHTSTSGSGCTVDNIWNSGTLATNATFSNTFSTVGDFPYHCAFHCGSGMTGSITVIDPNATGVSSEKSFKLATNAYPNPFSGSSAVQFNLSESAKVKVELVDMLGNKVFESSEEGYSAGEQKIEIAGKDLINGLFICKIYVNGIPAGSSYLVKENK